jgi:hypothetical protein
MTYSASEFLDDVSWQLEPWASLNDATGFHIGEGRWLRDRRFTNDYIKFMYNGGDDRHFTDYMADSTWSRYLVDGDAPAATAHIDTQLGLYQEWNDHFDASIGLYWVEPLLDATEYTISSIDASGGQDGFTGGEAFRPSINSYMWANALAIANAAALANRTDIAVQYRAKAAALKTIFQDNIWNSTLEHFIDRYQVNNENVTFWDPIRGRELVGLVPWMFGMPDDNATYSEAWKHILSTDELLGSNGLRTNEPSYQYYMRQYRYDAATGLRECQWNGPVWPFQTTQVLLGMANLLNDYTQSVIDPTTYLHTLRTYSNLHYINGTRMMDLQEDYEPDKPGQIVGLPRSHHYFHSGYIDVIISGLVGIRPQADDSIVVRPLVDGSISYFCLQDVLYHGRNVTVTWDSNGTRYHRGAGLSIEIDGRLAAHAHTLKQLSAPLTRKPVPALNTEICKSVQLVRGQYPIGFASSASGNQSESIHDAIDGRIWFFAEEPNGWESNATATESEQWYSIDFGNATSISRAEIALFVDGAEFVLPRSYEIETRDGSQWTKCKGSKVALVGNGITNLQWKTLEANQIRFSFVQEGGKRTRLVEFKVY